jgi:uncharacterized protein YggE
MKSRRLLLLLGVAAALPLVRGLAQDDAPAPPAVTPAAVPNRISIRTRARVSAPADELELELVVQGTADDAREAEKKHRERLKRVVAALTGKDAATKEDDSSDDDDDADKPAKKSKHKKRRASADADETFPTPDVPDQDGLVYSVREGRYTLGVKGDPAEAADDPNGQGETKETELACGSCVHVTLKGLKGSAPSKIRRILASVLERASDAGADLGPPKTHLKPTLRFRVSNVEALKKQAYADAIAKGRARAEYLAQLAGRKLGKLSVIEDLPEGQPLGSDDGRVSDYEAVLAALQASDASSPDTFSGSSVVAIEVGVELGFDLE